MQVHAGFGGGGAFKAPATGDAFNHNHASSMAHAAAGRRAIASALGSVKSFTSPTAMTPPGVTTGGSVAPPTATPPGMGATPPGMGQAPGTGPMPGGAAPSAELKQLHKGNFKALIAGQLRNHLGLQVTHDAVQGAIGRLGQKGTFTPEQASGLQAHTGPLQFPQGTQTMNQIAQEIVKPSGPVTA